MPDNEKTLDLSTPTDPTVGDMTYVTRRDNPGERGLVVGYASSEATWALIAWGEASKLVTHYAAAEAVREDTAGLIRWEDRPGAPGPEAVDALAPKPDEPIAVSLVRVTGWAAYRAGEPRIPIENPIVVAAVEGMRVGEGAADIFAAFLAGWDLGAEQAAQAALAETEPDPVLVARVAGRLRATGRYGSEAEEMVGDVLAALVLAAPAPTRGPLGAVHAFHHEFRGRASAEGLCGQQGWRAPDMVVNCPACLALLAGAGAGVNA